MSARAHAPIGAALALDGNSSREQRERSAVVGRAAARSRAGKGDEAAKAAEERAWLEWYALAWWGLVGDALALALPPAAHTAAAAEAVAGGSAAAN